MAGFLDILPFGLGVYEPQSAVDPDFDPWERATAFHCLRLLKLLGIEQRCIANHLNVTVSSVSMWMNQHRATPAKYRSALQAYASVMLGKAIQHLAKEKESLPQALGQAAYLEFYAALRRWSLEIQHEGGLLDKTIREECRKIGPYADHARLTPEERQTLMYLCKTIQVQLRTLEELENPPENDPEEPTHGQ